MSNDSLKSNSLVALFFLRRDDVQPHAEYAMMTNPDTSPGSFLRRARIDDCSSPPPLSFFHAIIPKHHLFIIFPYFFHIMDDTNTYRLSHTANGA